jgi:hypothetical protein
MNKPENKLTRDQRKLLALLKIKREQRWRKGMIQCAVCFDIINQEQWKYLTKQIEEGEEVLIL